jgi:hypothetical protein
MEGFQDLLGIVMILELLFSGCENILHIKMSLVQWLVGWISRKNARVGTASVNELPASRILSWLHFL